MKLKYCLALLMLLISIILKAEPKAKFGYMLFEAEKEWYAEDSLARIGVNIGECGGWQCFKTGCIISIYNKTEDVLYVDLSQCFISRNNNSQVLWDNTSIINTAGSSSGNSVNLGSITNALDIKGPIGSLASGVNINNGSMNSQSTITQAEKIVTVAPLSNHIINVPILPTHLALPNFVIRKTTGWNKNRIDGITLVNTDLYAGQILTYTLETSPIRVSFFVKYSDSPEFTKAYKQRLNVYAKELIGTKKTACWDGEKAKKELEKYGKEGINVYMHCMPFYVDKNWIY